MKGSFKVSYALLDDQWYHLEVEEGLSEQRCFVGNDVGIKEVILVGHFNFMHKFFFFLYSKLLFEL